MNTQTDTVETWKPVVGYEGRYEVSNLGRIRSLDQLVTGGQGGRRPIRGKVRAIQVGSHRHAYVCLGHSKKRFVHTMVAEAFIGSRPQGCECNHIDGNPLNNRVENLEWVTHQENMAHASRTRLLCFGEERKNSKLTSAKVAEIKRLLGIGMQATEIGKLFQIHSNTIQDIKKGRTWVSIPSN